MCARNNLYHQPNKTMLIENTHQTFSCLWRLWKFVLKVYPDPGDLISLIFLPVYHHWKMGRIHLSFYRSPLKVDSFGCQFPIDYDQKICWSSLWRICQLYNSPMSTLCFYVSVPMFFCRKLKKKTPGQHVQSHLPFCWQPRWWGELRGCQKPHGLRRESKGVWSHTERCRVLSIGIGGIALKPNFFL